MRFSCSSKCQMLSITSVLYLILGGAVMFGWPAIAWDLLREDSLLHNAIANQTLMVIAPLYIMMCIRTYW